jgi:hypothetical protein
MAVYIGQVTIFTACNPGWWALQPVFASMTFSKPAGNEAQSQLALSEFTTLSEILTF